MKYIIEKGWLIDRYVNHLASVSEIALEVGCSTHLIKKKLKEWSIHRGKSAIIGKPAWNKGIKASENLTVAKMTKSMREGFGSPQTREKMAKAKQGLRGENANNWKGGVYEGGSSGYLRTTVNGNRKYLHRHIVEVLIGRALTETEQVHHIDMNRKNNQPSNLIVLSIDDHTRLHQAMSENPDVNQIEWLVENQIEFIEVKKYENKEYNAA